MMSPRTTVIALRQIAIRYNLSLSKGFLACKIYQLREMYNGAGPDAFPVVLRRLFTTVLHKFQPAFLDHDYAYGLLKDRSYRAFTAANWRLLINGLRISIRNYAPFPPTLTMFLRAILVSVLMSVCCQLGGWRGWASQSKRMRPDTSDRFALGFNNQSPRRRKKRRF